MGGSDGGAWWDVEIWANADGRAPFEEWANDLSEYQQAVLFAAIQKVLKRLGMDICGSEWGKPLGDGLFEFRIRQSLNAIFGWGEASKPAPQQGGDAPVLLRVFVTFYGSQVVLLLGGYDKGADTSARRQQKEIRRAKRELAAFKAGRKRGR